MSSVGWYHKMAPPNKPEVRNGAGTYLSRRLLTSVRAPF